MLCVSDGEPSAFRSLQANSASNDSPEAGETCMFKLTMLETPWNHNHANSALKRGVPITIQKKNGAFSTRDWEIELLHELG
jgi:hypothetical protein